MTGKKFTILLLSLFFATQLIRVVLVYFIDPIGIWGAPVIPGFNNYKFKQGSFLDVVKPYEYMREKPDILYIGASQNYVGFRPVDDEHPEKKVYTMGLSSLSFPDLREYLRFVYKVHKPEVIYLGIRPAEFDKRGYDLDRNGFSKDRLEHLANLPFAYQWQGLMDSFSLQDTYYQTVKRSRNNPQVPAFFDKGWDVQRGTANEPDKKVYYQYIWAIAEQQQALTLMPEALDCFAEIVAEAREAQVPLVVFFTPDSVDRLAMNHIMGNYPEIQRIKRLASAITPIYDFNIVSDLTQNRLDYYFDADHFKATMGDKLKPILSGASSPEPYGYLLTPKNINAAFAAEDAAWAEWQQKNSDYLTTLTNFVETNQPPAPGELENYIGF